MLDCHLNPEPEQLIECNDCGRMTDVAEQRNGSWLCEDCCEHGPRPCECGEWHGGSGELCELCEAEIEPKKETA